VVGWGSLHSDPGKVHRHRLLAGASRPAAISTATSPSWSAASEISSP